MDFCPTGLRSTCLSLVDEHDFENIGAALLQMIDNYRLTVRHLHFEPLRIAFLLVLYRTDYCHGDIIRWNVNLYYHARCTICKDTRKIRLWRYGYT